jgi:hypothetical protein
MLEKLADLETQLREFSHEGKALEIIKEFAKQLGKTKERQIVFSTPGALIRQPILYQDVLEKGLIRSDEDPFTLLQGDLVSTDAAYFLGERLTGMKFAIASSTCDLVLNRRENAALLRIEPITVDYPNVKQILGELLSFKSSQRMYLPPLEGDSEKVIANSILFDGIIQIRLDDLLMATRHASLSLVGWRIFGSLVRTILVRAGESEVEMRTALSKQKT